MRKKILLILIAFVSILFINIDSGKCDETITNENNNSGFSGAHGGTASCGSFQTGVGCDEMQAIQVRIYHSNGTLVLGPVYVRLYGSIKSGTLVKLKDEYKAEFNYTSLKNLSGHFTTDSLNSSSIKYLSGYDQPIWGLWFSESNKLADFFERNNYAKFKELLNLIGYSYNYNTSRDDYAIIEPLVTVKIEGKFYTGTINALIASDKGFHTNGWAFVNFYSMVAQTFKINGSGSCHDSTQYTTSDKKAKIYRLSYDTAYNKCGYNKYNIYDVMKTPCTYDGKNYYDDNGSLTTKAGYELACGCKIIDGVYHLKNGTITNDKATYEKQCLACSQRATTKNPIDRLSLYENYKSDNTIYNQLLNFTKTGVDACKDVENTSFDASCLRANLKTTSTFDEKDISGYNFTIAMPTGDRKAYCLASYDLTPLISTPHLGTARKGGMAFIGGTNTSFNIATGSLNLRCYLYNPTTGDENVDVFRNLNYDSFISSITFVGQPLISVSNDVENRITPLKGNYENTNYIKYEKTIVRTYVVPQAKVTIGNGKVIDDYSVATRAIYGYFSKFSDNGTVNVDFSINLNKSILLNKTLSYTDSQSCYYDIGGSGGAYIEPKFRTIDTLNPFIGKNDRDANGNGRLVGANWCYQKSDSKWDCSSNNRLVQDVIINSNNSYNIKKQQPLYKITLTPSDVEEIRKYNKIHMLDEYELVCDSNYNCKSKFFLTIKDSISIGSEKLVP